MFVLHVALVAMAAVRHRSIVEATVKKNVK